ncbi:hypothetical protein GF338_03155 [candidate division WOR-3 bacterium]|nr:hypothetical protein [candidate division WOR-3 bacterium]
MVEGVVMKYELKYLDEHGVLFLKMLAELKDESEIKELMSEIRGEYEKHEFDRILCDISHSGSSISKEARRAFKDTASMVDFKRIAMVGGNPPMRMMAKVILAVTGTSKNTQFFKNKDEALKWLKEN